MAWAENFTVYHFGFLVCFVSNRRGSAHAAREGPHLLRIHRDTTRYGAAERWKKSRGNTMGNTSRRSCEIIKMQKAENFKAEIIGLRWPSPPAYFNAPTPTADMLRPIILVVSMWLSGAICATLPTRTTQTSNITPIAHSGSPNSSPTLVRSDSIATSSPPQSQADKRLQPPPVMHPFPCRRQGCNGCGCDVLSAVIGAVLTQSSSEAPLKA
ncbi:hypothetical protein B0H19DRAFT_1080445 [Mycena capillaripes]|nr:hypothetical protein B0H19DRAFT_1080445 [Mycena capillaripes]